MVKWTLDEPVSVIHWSYAAMNPVFKSQDVFNSAFCLLLNEQILYLCNHDTLYFSPWQLEVQRVKGHTSVKENNAETLAAVHRTCATHHISMELH